MRRRILYRRADAFGHPKVFHERGDITAFVRRKARGHNYPHHPSDKSAIKRRQNPWRFDPIPCFRPLEREARLLQTLVATVCKKSIRLQ